MIKQFDFAPIAGTKAATLPKFVDAVNDTFGKVARSLPGAVAQDVSAAAVRKTVKLGLADLTTVTLEGDAILVLDVDGVRAGVSAWLELVQDATGGHVPTWVNATADGGDVPAPSTVAESRSMYLGIYNGMSWVLFALASGYTTAASDRAVEAALLRLQTAMLPLPRVEVLDADYALTFDT